MPATLAERRREQEVKSRVMEGMTGKWRFLRADKTAPKTPRVRAFTKSELDEIVQQR